MTSMAPKQKANIPLFERKISVTFLIDALIFLYVTSIYIFSFNSVENNMISKLLALLLMGLLALYAIIDGKIIFNKFSGYFGLFILFCAISGFWAIEMALSFTMVSTLLQIFVLTFLLYNYLRQENKTDFFIHVLCLSGTIFAIYTVLFFGVEAYFSGLEDGMQMGGEIANANTVGMSTATASAISLWFAFYQKKYWYLICAAICTVVSFGSGSRTALIGMVLQVVLLFVLKGNSKKKIVSLFECVLLLAVLYCVLQLPIFETINHRMEGLLNYFSGQGRVDGSTTSRMGMIEAGLEQFAQTPFTGVGIGNTGYITLICEGRFTYLHNNYVELLSSVGIVGTAIYYLMYVTPLFQLAKPAFRQDKYAILAVILIIGALILHYGTVQYYIKTSYIYLTLFFLISDKERQAKANAL